jgi:hypothetical protein
MQIIEAKINEDGVVQLLEPVKISGTHRALVTIFEEETEPSQQRPYGLCAGDFVIPDDFDAPLPVEILDAFESAL